MESSFASDMERVRRYVKHHCYAITGSIATGKSTVLSYLGELGYPTFDADHLARDLTQVGAVGWQAIGKQECFQDCFDAAGEIRRDVLRERVFASKEAKALLERLLHPLIDESFVKCVSKVMDREICFYEASLILECQQSHKFKGVIVVSSRKDEQHARLQARDGWSSLEIEAAIEAQMPQKEKERLGDYVISTSQSHWRQELRGLVAALKRECA